jgi:membrane-bound ClpP family serine protease
MPDGEFVRQVRASSEEAHQYLQTDHDAHGRYRIAAMLVALVLAATGVVALVTAGDVPFSGPAGHGFLGLSLNRAGGVLLLALAAAVLAAALMRGSLGAGALTGVGILILLVGLLVLAVNRTPANVVAFSVIDVCALWLAAMVVLWCGMHTFEADEHRTLLGDQKTEYREPSR